MPNFITFLFFAFLWHYIAKNVTFRLAVFGGPTHCRRRLMTYFESWKRVRYMCFDVKYWFEIWLYLARTWPYHRQVRFHDGVESNGRHYRYTYTLTHNHYRYAYILSVYVQNSQENMRRMACLWLLFYSDVLWPDLDLHVLRMTFVLTQYHS